MNLLFFIFLVLVSSVRLGYAQQIEELDDADLLTYLEDTGDKTPWCIKIHGTGLIEYHVMGTGPDGTVTTTATKKQILTIFRFIRNSSLEKLTGEEFSDGIPGSLISLESRNLKIWLEDPRHNIIPQSVRQAMRQFRDEVFHPSKGGD